MFDTHCHLNFSSFKNNLTEVVERAKENGVYTIIVPGTEVESSQKAIEVAEKYEGIYAAVGIHPHHVYQYQISNIKSQIDGSVLQNNLDQLEKLLTHPKVVAIGEVGMDRHDYDRTKYSQYQVDTNFIALQRDFLIKQIRLSLKYDKSLILHNWEAKKEILELLNEVWDSKLEYKTVFHCCEPDDELLAFAKDHHMFIGVDGDITYNKKKQEFIKHIPLEMMVLETDSPFLLPEPLRSQKQYHGPQRQQTSLHGRRVSTPSISFLGHGRRANEPNNILLIAEFINKFLHIPFNQLTGITTENAKRLFAL